MIGSIIETTYPAQINYLYSLSITISGLDILQGPYWYAKIFDFKATAPFSPTFDTYQFSTQNLFYNSGSLILVVAITVVSSAGSHALDWIASKTDKGSIWRKAAQKTKKY